MKAVLGWPCSGGRGWLVWASIERRGEGFEGIKGRGSHADVAVALSGENQERKREDQARKREDEARTVVLTLP